MGMTPGSTGTNFLKGDPSDDTTQNSTAMNFLKGGLTGLSQGLANYNNPHPVFDFSGLAKGFQAKRQALGKYTTPGAAQTAGSSTNYILGGDPNGVIYD